MIVGVDGSVFVKQLTGIGNYVYHLLCETAQLRKDLKFIVYSPASICVEFPFENVEIKQYSGVGILGAGRVKKLWWLNVVLPLALRQDNAKVFWAANGISPIYIPCRLLLTVYDFVYLTVPHTMSRIPRLNRRYSQPKSIQAAKSIFVISQMIAKELMDFYAKQADEIIKPAVSKEFYKRSELEVDALKNKYQLPEEYFLIVGTLEPRKNLELFFECVLNEVGQRENFPPIMIIGGAGWIDGPIVKIIQEVENKGVARRLGYVDTLDLPKLYSGARALIMPSIYEGFGMPLLEARMCCCPVICSDIAAMREAAGNQAYFFTPDWTGISNMLKELLMGNVALNSDCGLCVDWTWSQGAEKLSGLLDKIMLNKK